ncbi:hypothetical protein AAFF_G00018350 [Aldrovandia affinis]|uniref:Integrase catalytic domain-containing protein n=1 Tax=Aldrovandia affinis TaxID=143900 RepID=A0AAD7S5U3_9TELE|nr:hypothetical protein AAFF_G00018350 [Aldrovandia affinis]
MNIETEFWNKVNQILFEKWGAKHRITSAYHPQTNGLDERTNQTLKRAIGKSLDGHQEQWEDNLKITGDIPPLVEVDGIDEDTVADYLQARAEKDEEVFDKVRLNAEKAQ